MAMRRLFNRTQPSCPQACKKELLAVRSTAFDHLLANRVGGEIYCTGCLRGHQLLSKAAFERYCIDDVRPLSYYSVGKRVIYQGVSRPDLQGRLAKIVAIIGDRPAENDAASEAWSGSLEIEFESEIGFGNNAINQMVVKSYDLRVYKGLSVEGQHLLNQLAVLNQSVLNQSVLNQSVLNQSA
jgi:hypothetical protein